MKQKFLNHLQFNEEVPSEDNIPYGFGYFHLVFALGSMYFGMLLVGWNAHKTTERELQT
jgi:hypothetical protein